MKTFAIAIASLAIGVLATWAVIHKPGLSAAERHALLTVVSLKAVYSKTDGVYSRTDLGLAEEAEKLPDSELSQALRRLALSARFVENEPAAREFTSKCDGLITIYGNMAAK